MKEVLTVSGFPKDFCINLVILNRYFCVKKCDASLLYFVFKID